MNIHHFRRSIAAVTFVAALVLSGCHKKVVAPPTAALPPPPPPPTARIAIDPTVIASGQSATLTWSTTNADKVMISSLGAVPVSGSRTVSPTRSTDYTVTATGANGAAIQATARVTVNPPVVAAVAAPASAPSLTDEQLFAQNVHDVFFDYDKYSLRSSDETTAEQDAAFLKSHPGMKVLIEGHCDDRGSEEYNEALGESRAESLKKALVEDGVAASRINIVSDGEEKPFCSEENESCWQQNRRDHLRLDRQGQ